MLKKLLDLLSNFFSALFGGKKTEPVAKPTTRPANDGDLFDDSHDLPADTVVTEVRLSDVEAFASSGPFGDDDKDSAFEEPTTSTGPSGTSQPNQPAPVPTSGTGAGSPSTTTGGASTTGGGTTPSSPTPPQPPTPTPPTVPPSTTGHVPRYLWCLNNGHGKLQDGKRSPVFDDGVTQFLEYKFNRDIVVRIMKALDKKGVKYFDVVPDVETVGQFPARVKRANDVPSELPKIYVAVHANAVDPPPGKKWGSPSASGIETWFSKGSKKGVLIAAVFQRHIVAKTGMNDRGLKSPPLDKPFFELKNTDMPAVLTENGFFSNEKEVKELMKDEVRQKIADAHVAAILEIEANGIV